MNARELEILKLEAQAEVDALLEEFLKEWQGERAQESADGS